MKRILPICLLALASGVLLAQEPSQPPQTTTEQQVTPISPTPVYHVQVVSRTTKAVNYRHHSGKTEVGFRGTELMPQAEGRAEVESRTGRTEVEAKFENLQKPRTFGPEYLIYVLWAITPEGRPVNLGEVMPNDDGKSSIKVSTDLQAFGLIVTAEPYFAVTRPSNQVILENVIKSDTKGSEQPIDARFDLLEAGSYRVNLNAEQLPALSADSKTPVDLLEAMNAIAIARAAGAEKYAAAPFQKAEDQLAQAQDYYRRDQDKKAIETAARAAAQSAEDARVLAIRTEEQERQEAERRQTEQQAEQARLNAQQAQMQAQQAQTQADIEARQRQQAEQEQQQAEAERQRAEQAKAEAEQARQQAESAAAQAQAQQQAAQTQAQQAQMQAQQAELEKEQTRQRLMQQLNQVLQTRETARGLIVSMPDVLFDTGQYTLKPGARERLAKVAGILQSYPGLKVQVEGHTDNTGTAAFNQQLSQERANAVREYLAQQGVAPNSITAQGFGESQPVASNGNAAGRQLNRRVDLVVSGEAISPNQSTMPAGQQTAPGMQPPAQTPQPEIPH